MLNFDHSDRDEYVQALISQDGFTRDEAEDDYDALYHQQWEELEFENFGHVDDDVVERTWLYDNPDRLWICKCGQQTQRDCEEYCLKLGLNPHLFLRGDSLEMDDEDG